MKSLKQYINESVCIGVTNHYTPIGNIISNVKNLYGEILGFLVLPDSANSGIILRSSKFTSEDAASKIMYAQLYQNSNGNSATVAYYIQSMGLTKMEYVQRGDGTYDVWFGAEDLYNVPSIPPSDDF